MNFSLFAILAAFLCAAAVTGAPTSSNLSYEELVLSESFGLADQLPKYWHNFKCVSAVIEQDASPEVKALYAVFKAELYKLHDEEWTKCKELSDISEQRKCKLAVIQHAIPIYTKFYSELLKVAKWEKVIEIGQTIVEKCIKQGDAEEFAGESFPEQFQCIADVVGEVSKANDLGDLWSKTQPQMQLHIDNWKGCANIGNKFGQILCNLKEGYATYHLFSEYLKLAAAQKPTVVLQIVRAIQQKCTKRSAEAVFDLDEVNVNDISGIVDKIKCISSALTDALKETDFETPLNGLKAELEQLAGRLLACKSSNFWETAKCIAEETNAAKTAIQRFLKDLENANKDAFERAKKYIKQRCQ